MRWLMPLMLCSCSAEIGHGLDEASANEMVLALDHAGVRAEKEADPGTRASFSVRVANRSVGRALETLRAQGLPRAPEVGLEVFDDPGWVPTAIEERARYEHAVAGELARSIESLDGVLDARVHVAVPTRSPVGASDSLPPKPRASVLIQVDGKGSPVGEDDVRELVTGAISGIAPSDVRVVVARRTAARPAVRPRRVVSVTWLVAATVVIAGLAVALLISIAHNRSIGRRAWARDNKERGQ